MAKTTSGEYLKVSLVKISARSDEFKGKLSVAQSCDLDEKPVFEKNEK
jgi:hypothetical protein